METFSQFSETVFEIGRGAAGIVYFDETQPKYVYKISNKNNQFRDWKKEKQLYEHINTFNIDSEHIKLLKMTDYHIDDNGCKLQLTRAVNPIDPNMKFTIHPLFGLKSIKYKDTHRGLFIGLDELYGENCMFHGLEPATVFIEELGRVMAKLHYEVKNDGFDIELFLSSRVDDINKSTRVYIGDFDLSETITEYNDYYIERMVWCFQAVPYFPTEGELFDVFSSAYISEATRYKMKHIAQTVISRTDTNIKKK